MEKINEIMILGHKISIVYKEMDDHGEWHEDERYISISDKLSGEMLKTTLCHEAFHACLSMSGIEAMLSDDLNEGITRMTEYNYLKIVREIYSEMAK